MTWRYSRGWVLLGSGLVLASCLVLIMHSLPGEPATAVSLERPAREQSSDPPRTAGAQGSARLAGAPAPMAATEGLGLAGVSDPEKAPEHPADRVASVYGQVVDAISGAPVQQFQIFYAGVGDGDLLDRASRDPDSGILRNDLKGRFRLTGLPEGTYSVLIDPAASGYERTVIHDVVVPRSQPLVARVGRGAHVEGRLLDALERAVPDVEVALGDASSTGGEAPAPAGTRTTDEEGRFLFTRVPAGVYRLSTAGIAEEETQAFPVLENTRVERDLRLPIANSLCIVVTDPAGSPVGGARVLLSSRSGLLRRAVTDARGEARVWALPGDRHVVRTNCTGFRVDNQTVEMMAVGDQILRVVLTSSGG